MQDLSLICRCPVFFMQKSTSLSFSDRLTKFILLQAKMIEILRRFLERSVVGYIRYPYNGINTDTCAVVRTSNCVSMCYIELLCPILIVVFRCLLLSIHTLYQFVKLIVNASTPNQIMI